MNRSARAETEPVHVARAMEAMLCRSVLAGVILGLGGMSAAAAPVRVSFDWPAGAPAFTAAQIHVHAVRLAGDTASAAPVDADTAPEGVVLDLSAGVWQVQAYAGGYWSQGAEVTVGATPGAVRLAFWPAASLHGKIEAAQGQSLPGSINVKLRASQTAGGDITPAQPAAPPLKAGPAQAELNCRIAAGEWSCLAPAGVFDARLEVAGFVPRYAWGVNLKTAEMADLGDTELQRALSVFGRAVPKVGSGPPGSCRATLQPDAERRGGAGPDPDNPPATEKTFTVPVNREGHFQIAGVMPGRHLLTVDCAAASGLAELDVQPEGETRVDPPVTLEELTLDIGVSPRADPAGKPWQLSVEATAPRLRTIADAAAVDANGRWMRRGLMAGSYRVAVASSDGVEWLKKDFELQPGSAPLALRLASVRVAGRVLLNSLPVRARLVFSNQAGGDAVTLQSDDRGGFTGLLPIAAGAQETFWSVEAHVAHPSTTRQLAEVDVPTVASGARAWLDLTLPTIPVRGSVTREDGRPENGAQITFEAAGSGYRTATSSDGEGGFEMEDLPAGKYNAVAESPYGVSDPAPFTVADGSQSELKLTLHPNLHIPFYVVSSDGPIAGATVQVWMAPGVPRALGHTDQNGRFEVTLPPGTSEVGLTVGAPDYAIRLLKMPVSSAPSANDGNQPSDQNTVTLGTTGGTLVLNFEPPEGALDRAATPYLVHNGAIVDARTLAGWGTDQAGANSDEPAEVDGIEPGDYALCVVTDPSQLATLWQGNVPKDRCSTGAVTQGQTLTLAPIQP